jgi:hypothetical protein
MKLCRHFEMGSLSDIFRLTASFIADVAPTSYSCFDKVKPVSFIYTLFSDFRFFIAFAISLSDFFFFCLSARPPNFPFLRAPLA